MYCYYRCASVCDCALLILHFRLVPDHGWRQDPHKRKLLRGSVTHSTISMGQVGLAFSRRQHCLFKIKIGTFKDIKVCSSPGLKRRKFPDVILTDREKTDYFRARVNNPVSRTSLRN